MVYDVRGCGVTANASAICAIQTWRSSGGNIPARAGSETGPHRKQPQGFGLRPCAENATGFFFQGRFNMKRLCLFALLGSIPLPGATGQPTAPAQSAPAASVCESLKDLSLPQTTITLAESRDAKPFIPQGTTATIAPSIPFCRVAGVIDPEIRFEVWMPASANWNGKFNGVGNGGLAGFINYAAMNAALSRDYATASTDTGHLGGNGSWALGRPELLVDFASRAIHVMTLAAKMVVQAYYGQAPRYSYFTGCSGGGGQGASEAQRYPWTIRVSCPERLPIM
jgi:hypothetical protein